VKATRTAAPPRTATVLASTFWVKPLDLEVAAAAADEEDAAMLLELELDAAAALDDEEDEDDDEEELLALDELEAAAAAVLPELVAETVPATADSETDPVKQEVEVPA